MVARPQQAVQVTVAGATRSATTDARGVVSLTLTQPLQSGDVIEVEALGLSGASAPTRVELP